MMMQQEIATNATIWWKKNVWRGRRKTKKEGNDEKIVTINETKDEKKIKITTKMKDKKW